MKFPHYPIRCFHIGILILIMKKMKTLFEREFQNHKLVGIHNVVSEDCMWVLRGEGIATRKLDGTCCMIKNNEMYARFDMKPGRELPLGAVPCQDEPDSITGHFPHWIKITNNKIYKWHKKAFNNSCESLVDGTYELIGEHFNGNPEHIESGDILVKHGSIILEDVPRTFEGIREYLSNNEIEGIVFHRNDGSGDMCKIKRVDFGFMWNGKTIN